MSEEKGMSRSEITRAVREGVDLSRGVFVDRDLREQHWRRAKFARCDFSRSNLSYCELQHADFTGALLVGAELTGCYLEYTNFTEANLTNCRIWGSDFNEAIFKDAIGIHDAGMDHRGYRFVGVWFTERGWYVAAGCRWLPLPMAVSHWTRRNNSDALRRVAEIEHAPHP